MRNILLLIVGFISFLGVAFMMSYTDPAELHPAGILLFFFLLYVGFIIVFMLFVYYFSRVFSHLFAVFGLQRKGRSETLVTMKKAYLYATALALSPIMLLAMHSVGAVGLLDILLVIVFELIACTYVWKRA